MDEMIQGSINEESKKQIIIPYEISNRITALRFILVLFVVFSHNNLDIAFALRNNISFSEPLFLTYIKLFICKVLGEAAVPLFFLFSGYLQFSKNDTYPKLLRKRARSLLLPFVIWTFIRIVFAFLPFFSEARNIRECSVKDWLNFFWVYQDGKYPLISHFWFLRNLIVLVILSPVLKFLANKFRFIFLTCLVFCYMKGLPLNFGTSLFFYMAGFFFAEYKVDFFKLADKCKWFECIILLVCIMIINIFFNEQINLLKIDVVISAIFFLKVSYMITTHDKLFSYFKYLSDFSFFLYSCHQPWLLSPLKALSYKIIPLNGIGTVVQFIIPSVITIIVGTGIGIVLKKIFPPLFGLLNGGRR